MARRRRSRKVLDAGFRETQCPADVVADPSLWPTPLQRFVQPRGADVVWKVGLAVLGYPPTWCDSVKEANKVVEALEAFDQRKESER